MSNIVSIISNNTTHFLTNDGNIYFCGHFERDGNNFTLQKTPKLLKTEIQFHTLHCNNQDTSRVENTIAETNSNLIVRIKGVNIEITRYNTAVELYLNDYQMTPKTLELKEGGELASYEVQIYFSNQKRFKLRFLELAKLGSGVFGTVVKVKDKCTKRLTAVKKIHFKGKILF